MKTKITFKPADFIVTSDGLRGYVVKKVGKSYQIRLATGLTVRSGDELALDPLMQD